MSKSSERPKENRRTKFVHCDNCQAEYRVRPDTAANRCRVCKAPLTQCYSSSLAGEILKRIKVREYSLVELSDELDVSPRRVLEVLAELKDKDCYCVSCEPDRIAIDRPSPHPGEPFAINAADFFGSEVAIGAVSDTHCGSKWERLDVLNALYDIFEREGVKQVYHAGNIVEGEARFNRFDIKVHGVEQQIEYCSDHYPQRPGVATRFVTGDDHEGWWTQREGIDFGRRLQQTAHERGRDDLEYIGHVESDVCLKAKHGESVMRVMHPGGGTAYAVSYTGQKIVESLQGGEKPAILLLGHYHKFEYSYIRNVHVVQLGCVADQSIFMRKRKIEAHVGGCIIRFNQGDLGEINRFRVEWIPFFDRGFYERKYDITRASS